MKHHIDTLARCARWMGAALTATLLSAASWPGCGELPQPIAPPIEDEACAEVTCSGRGVCVVVADDPTCACDPNYHPDGLNCLPDDDDGGGGGPLPDPDAPRVVAVTPLEATLHQPQTFEVLGANLSADTVFKLDECDGVERVGAVDPHRLKFACVPRAVGALRGSVAEHADAEEALEVFWVQVRDGDTALCDGDAIAPCGPCMLGVQTRTCDEDGWSAWSDCRDAQVCEPGATMACQDGSGAMVCDDACAWDFSACDTAPTVLDCQGPDTQPCGMCGVQTRTCDTATGRYSAWSACTDEGVCAPNTERTCGNGGIETCTASCAWSGQCDHQTCEGPDTEACGFCGTRARGCSHGQWTGWTACYEAGVCAPGATQRCGINNTGTQTCSDACGWSSCVTPEPSVTSVSPLTAVEHQSTSFTVNGQNLPTTLAMWIDTCDAMEQISHTATRVRFQCTPRYGTGSRELIVKDRPGGTILHSGTVTVTPAPSSCSSPTVTTVSPTSARLNQATTFTVQGCGLPNTTAMWIDQCDGMTQTAHASDRVTFRCTPRWDRGTKSAVVKDRPGGNTLRSFTVRVD